MSDDRAQVVCTHLDDLPERVAPSVDGCEDCLRTGDEWVHLRLCLSCAHVGCCDDSKNLHARAHWRKQGHPIIQSFEPDESWVWCYVDEVGFE